ncbi:MAG: putative Ig domain-containing protein, partial [Trebonia sp.]
RGPAGPEAALAVLKGSLLGLAAAHAAGIVHRDYKPENVLVDAEGSSKLADFGVAVRAGKRQPAAGTPLYMAPEQWNGAPGSPATDVYAAAAVFFECLTGKTPFSGRATRLRQQHETAGVPLDQVPEPALRSLIVRGMAKSPADRPQSAIAFVSELETVAAAAYGPDWEARGRGHLAVRVAALLPLLLLSGGTVGSSGTSTATSWLGGRNVLHVGRKALHTGHLAAAPARRKALTVASIGTAAVVVAAVAAMAVTLTGKNTPTAQLTSVSSAASTTLPTVQAAVTPPVVAASHCTAPTSFSYQGTITATAPGPVSYRWLYSSGQQGPVQTADFAAAGHRQVIGSTVQTMAKGTGWAEIQMLSPAGVTSNRASYQLLCGGNAAEISAAGAMQSASQTVVCGTPAPRFTAKGSITSRNAQKVTYHWALSDGRSTPSATMTFSGAGEQQAETLLFTPEGSSSSGDAVLVVTSPVAATSAPMPYTLSCQLPLQLAASAAVSPANETVSSCTAAPPVFTFTGEVTDNQTGTLSYYWKLPSGNGPVQTLSFAQAGTQTVTTTYQPSGDNTTGAGAIVVTSPGSATSNVTRFRLGCTRLSGPSSLAVTTDAPTVTVARVEQYYGTVTVSGGKGPYTWAAATGLPGGLTADTNGRTLTISGTPTRPGRYLVGVSVRDGESPARTVAVSIPIIVRPPVIVRLPRLTLTADVPTVTEVGDEEYYGTVTVFGGRGPYRWGPVTGLPDGLAAYASGTTLTISGMPTRPGRYLVDVSVRDRERPARTVTERIPVIVRRAPVEPVLTPPTLTTCVPRVVTVGEEDYSGTVTVFGGRGPYRWGPVTGLPDGLAAYASGATLTISGMPTRPGRFLVGVSVRDRERPARTVTEHIFIIVRPAIVSTSPLRITADVPAVATVDEEGYSGTATVSGGEGPYTWGPVTGLPDGLTAYANGTTLTISGTPARPGRFLAEVSVSDGESPARTETERIPIIVRPAIGAPPLRITADVPAAATAGQKGYSGTATVSGGKGPYAWAAVTGLPSGLTATANGATLTISGTPTKAGSFTLGLSVGDGESPARTATASATITVRSTPATTGPTTTGPTTTGPTTGPPTTTTPTTAPPTTTTAPPTKTTPTTAPPTKTRPPTPPLTITTAALPAATWKVAYSATVIASGGRGVDKWSATGLPSGLTATANGAALTISGTPTLAAGAIGDPVTDPVTVTVTDSGRPAHSTTRTFSLRVNPPTLTLVGGALTGGISGTAYAATASATGGAGAYTWSATGLPTGLTIGSTTGTITGTTPAVTAATTYRVTVTVADSESPARTATATFTITITPPTPTTSPAPPATTASATSTG